MSKIFPRFFLPLLAAAFIVACIRIPKQPQTTDPDTTPLTYRFDGGADLTALFTLQASYIAADGRTQTEQIASLPWAKEVGVSAPFGARLDVRFRKKADYPRQDVYAVGFSGGIDCASANAAIPPPLGLSRAGGAGNIVRLRFSLPDGVSPDDVSLRFAPLKYDQTFRVYIYLRRFLCHGLLPRLELDQCQVDRRPGIPPFGRHPHLGLCP